VIYGDHPASSMGLTKEALGKITRDNLVKFHHENYVPDHAIIGVAGDITLAEARTKFEAALKSWPKSGRPRPGVVDPPEAGPLKVSVVNRAASVQTSYMLGEQAINRTHPDYEAVQVMNTIFGGSNGRLFRELREVKGYTYGVYSQLRALRYRGDERVSMDVRTEVTEPALRDFMAEAAKMRNELVPDAEFKDAQRSMTASFALSLERPSEVLGLYVLRQLYNFPADYWDKYADRINAITPAQVQAVAKKYLDPAKLQIVAVGDSTKIEPSLRKLGPVELFDDEGRAVKASQ
jgi:predicted Zn-dependent peptidase